MTTTKPEGDQKCISHIAGTSTTTEPPHLFLHGNSSAGDEMGSPLDYSLMVCGDQPARSDPSSRVFVQALRWSRLDRDQ